MHIRDRVNRGANRGATAWTDQGNDGSWGRKLQNVFEFGVPHNTKLGFDNGLSIQAGSLQL
jgi:hypothetical protein